jgi:hypothetical protein
MAHFRGTLFVVAVLLLHGGFSTRSQSLHRVVRFGCPLQF